MTDAASRKNGSYTKASGIFYTKITMTHYIKILYVLIAFIALPAINPAVSALQHKETDLKAASDNKPYPEIPDVLISFDNHNGTKHAVVVEKSTQQLIVYSHKNHFKELYRFQCSTGEIPGKKFCSGDKKTPEGVYFFTNEYKKKDLSPTYGTRAFPIDYPNFFDRIEGRSGYSIWLHGTNRKMKPRDSNGCVALKNNDIDEVAKYIALNKTPIIIVDKLSYISSDNNDRIKESILNLLEIWTKALESGTYHEYLELYASEYLPDISWWKEWDKVKKAYSASDLNLCVAIKGESILKNDKVYVIFFDQVLESSNKKISAGSKKFYLTKKNGVFKIIGEEYQHSSAKNQKINPLVSAGINLKKSVEYKHKIAELVDGWLKAWSEKDIKRYGSYYSSGFRSQGMNLRTWLKYKNRLNSKYAFINVSKDNLTVEKIKNEIVVSFTQTYMSSAFKAKGIKKLILIQENGMWKIFRETWEKL